MNDIDRELAKLTARLIEYRKWRLRMALELKGLKGKAMSFRANIEAIEREYDGANAVASEHLIDVKALRAQVADMKDDLSAAVNITKNSVATSNGGGQQSEPNPEIDDAPQEVGALQPATFQSDK